MADSNRRPGTFSYADYLSWPDEDRWELIRGAAYDMTAAPSPLHQRLVVRLVTLLENATEVSTCDVYAAPFDVRLPDSVGTGKDDDAVETVVQPDVSVICDGTKVDERGYFGPPDLIIEILSPSTAYKDQTAKLALYEHCGVREYWVVNPERATVLAYRLDSAGGYAKPIEYRREETVRLSVAGEPVIDLGSVIRNLPS